jgi:hypothetical protein
MRCNSGETVSLIYFDGTTLGTLGVLTRSTVRYLRIIVTLDLRRRARRLNVGIQQIYRGSFLAVECRNQITLILFTWT